MYDIIIIGAGVTGCAVARYLSRYEGRMLVLEKADAGAVLATTAVDIINSYFSREDTVSIVPENQLIP